MSSTNQSNPITKTSYCLPADPQTGKVMELILQINTEVPEQVEEFEAVAATYPTSVQDFLIQLNELLKTKIYH